MSPMTTAERRGYQQICGDEGAMMVIACEQRGGMRTLLAKTPEEQAKIGNDVLGLTKADITAYLNPRAIAALDKCDKGWCRLSLEGVRGWTPETEVWGVAAPVQCR